MSSASGPRYTVREIAGVLGRTKRWVRESALRENWPFTLERGNGGQCHSYYIEDIPLEFRAKLLQEEAAQAAGEHNPNPSYRSGYDADELWLRAASRPANEREKGRARADAVYRVRTLMDREGASLHMAAERVAADLGDTSCRTLKRWCAACQDRAPQDWRAVLVPGRGGGRGKAAIDERAWRWFLKDHLDRSRPDLALSYRRTREAAEANGWGGLPSVDTFRRRVGQLSPGSLAVAREGARAAAQMHPPQRIDRSGIEAGRYVSGDGVKFDSLWVDWGRGGVINTSTAWFWVDMRTAFIMAHRVAPTETTTLIRLATYDLTATCLPDEVQVDNTRAVGGKVMTGGAKNRRRFKHKESDPRGLLLQLGIEPQFTNPDRVFGNPGAKLVERLFGKGGIHHRVKTFPGFRDRGISKKTAIPWEEFAEVVAQEARRWNEQAGRKGVTCGGRSCAQAFREDFLASEARKATPVQRALLLLEVKRVKVLGKRGEISIQGPTSGEIGRHRYWSLELEYYMGKYVDVYYDPADMEKPVTAHSVDGRLIGMAAHIPDTGFRDKAAAQEHAKSKRRLLKLRKRELEELGRMDQLEYQAAYPRIEDAEPPEPGVIVPNFGQQVRVVNGGVTGYLPEEVIGGPQDAKDRKIALEADDEIFEIFKRFKRSQETEI